MKIMNTRSVEKICAALLLAAVLLFFTSSPIAQETGDALTIVSDDGKMFESQLEELLTTVYCYCGCVKETIKACVCGTAQNVETDFRNRLSGGDTVDAIRTEYLEKWGPQFSALMPAKGVNLLAYLMPAVILIAIGGVIFIIRHQSSGNKIPAAQPNQQISDELQQKLESELEKYKEEN